MTERLDQLASDARRHPVTGMRALVAALQADATLAEQARARLAVYAAFSPGRLKACWITQTTQQTLKAALAQANNKSETAPNV